MRLAFVLCALSVSFYGQTIGNSALGSCNGTTEVCTSRYVGSSEDVQISSAIASLKGGNGIVYVDDAYMSSIWSVCPTWGAGNVTLILTASKYVYSAVATTCTIPASVLIRFTQGAILSVTDAGSKIVSSASVIAGDNQQIVDSSAAGLVVFNNLQKISATWYGAYGDNNVHDDYAAIQKAFDALCAVTNSPTLIFPAGIFEYSKIPRLRCGAVTIRGSGKNTTMLRPSYQGPAIIDLGSNTPVPLTAGLTTSGGNALVLDGGQNYDLNLNDVINVTRNGTTNTLLNGLTQLSVEFYVNITTNDSSARYITSSQGDPFQNDVSGDQIPTYEMFTQNGNIICTMNLSGVRKAVTATMSSSTTHFVSCDWDGSNIRLFVDGTQGATLVATGTLRQPIFQTNTVCNPARYMEAGSNNFCALGTVDSIRISDTVRHTTNYTAPTVKLTADANTVALLNFDNQTACDICTAVGTKHGTYHTWIRNVVAPNSNGFQTWSDLWFAQSAVFGGTAQASFRDVVFQGYPYAYYGWSNTFLTTMYNVNFLTSNSSCTFSMGLSGGGSGDITMINTNFGACGIALASSGDTSLIATGGLVQVSAPMVYAILLQAAGPANQYVFQNWNLSQEEGTGAQFVATMGLGQAGLEVDIYGSVIENFVTNPIGIIDGITSLNIDGMQVKLFPGDSGTSLFNILSAPAYPIHLHNTPQTVSGTFVPWCSNTDACFVDLQGFKTVTFSATPTFDCTKYSQWAMTLTGNVTSSTLSNCSKGPALSFTFCQDSTGGRTFAWPSNVIGGGSCSTANQCGVQQFLFDGINARAISSMMCN